MTIIAAEEANRGWGGPIALVLAVAAFITIVTVHDWWQRRQEDHSPTGEDDTDAGVKPQVRSVSDTNDTEDEPDADPGWWGRIVTVNGARVRQTRPVERTPTGLADDDIDLALEEQHGSETIEDTIARLTEEGTAYAEIVRTVMAQHRVSESTAKRRIRETRASLAS